MPDRIEYGRYCKTRIFSQFQKEVTDSVGLGILEDENNEPLQDENNDFLEDENG
jgi:hypothetical protein